MLTQQRLSTILEKFPRNRVAVVGDFFLDSYQEIDPELGEISVETGLAAHQVVRKWNSPGAAGTVVNNLRGLNLGELHAVGVTGDDGPAFELRRGLEERGCDTSSLLPFEDLFTPVYHKTMTKGIVGLEGERERFDTKNRSALPQSVEDALLAKIERLWPHLDAILVADQVEATNCGVVTERVRDLLLERAAADPSKVMWVDSRCRVGLYHGLSAKPNEAECVRAVEPKDTATDPHEHFDDETITRCGEALRAELAKPICVTRGKRGIWVFEEDRVTEVPGVQVPEPTDPTGAGDSTLAGIGMALAAGATLVEAAVIGVLVASITVQALGTTGFATPGQLPDRLELWLGQRGEQEEAAGPKCAQARKQ